MYFNVVGFRM